ncbi:uncharacterized protein LOC120260435 [Dioscorea cayenensis subsp. rotundata]|uniref:Uncharacterized protein LOC120260435 n=1 Tax=Dioscorea cayennensis subsp. rotundata TaxID=55577 RepID=A0AB40B9H4_DIOCR|nr:uncharacterized protein LOC120260435 [Dioscorea cayenensis subsp. rotundata]
MSLLLQSFSEAMDSRNLQVWNNAAFDAAADGGSCKENRSPRSPLQELCRKGVKVLDDDLDESKIDAEIEEIEREIRRLSARLDALKIKKMGRDSKASAGNARRGGRIVPAKFMEPSVKKIEESPGSVRSRRRGLSLGPAEISKLDSSRKLCFLKLDGVEEDKEPRSWSKTPKPWPSISRGTTPIGLGKAAQSPAGARDAIVPRRGMSLGPSEIFSATRLRPQSKLQEIKEKEVMGKERGRSSSTSPKSRRATDSKISDLRKGIATVGPKKTVKKEDTPLTNLKPKALFQEPKNSITGKRPMKIVKGRVVPSRYSLVNSRTTGDEQGSKRRKWSLPEVGKEEAPADESKRSLSLGEVEVRSMIAHSPPSIMKVAALLPKIRTTRCAAQSPRDSGRAKRVAELVGKTSHFGTATDDGTCSPCQSLNFDEEQ